MATFDSRTLNGAYVRVITADSVEVEGHLVFEVSGGDGSPFRLPRARLTNDLLWSNVNRRARRVSRISRRVVTCDG